MNYLVTGSTGFLGSYLIRRLLARDASRIYLLLRSSSDSGRQELLSSWKASATENGIDLQIVEGDLSDCEFALEVLSVPELDHVFHLAALYDMGADAAALEAVNVGGTIRLIEALSAGGFRGVFHYTSSTTIAGDYRGRFKEDMFDVGQTFQHPYNKSKFDAERYIRNECPFEYRVYRPGAIVGDSTTGHVPKIDGLYYFFEPIRTLLRYWPSNLPIPVPSGFAGLNLSTVDFVADAMVSIAHRDGLENQTFHLVDPEHYDFGEIAERLIRCIDPNRRVAKISKSLLSALPFEYTGLGAELPSMDIFAKGAARSLGMPESALTGYNGNVSFDSENTRKNLSQDDFRPNHLSNYIEQLWRYFDGNSGRLIDEENLRGIAGKKLLITGASSGIGAELARLSGTRGCEIILVARREHLLKDVSAEIGSSGGIAHVFVADLSKTSECDRLIEYMKAEHPDLDVLVNNAGRSIRRSIHESFDRPHDIERTIRINYLAPSRLMYGLLPLMIERGAGSVVNCLSVLGSYPVPRFAPYTASKTALASFSDAIASELLSDGIFITDIHFPLVATDMIKDSPIFNDLGPNDIIEVEDAAKAILDAIRTKTRSVTFGNQGLLGVVARLLPSANVTYLNFLYQIFHDHESIRERFTRERELIRPLISRPPF